MLEVNEIISILSLILSTIIFVRVCFRDNKTDESSLKEGILKANMKLDQVCATTVDIKSDIKAMQNTVGALENRISVLEEQLKVANHRIDDLETK